MAWHFPDSQTLRKWAKPLAIGLLMLVLNIVAWFLIPDNLSEILGAFGYLGVFLVNLAANATVAIPIPYIPLVMRMATELNIPLLVLISALGSMLGESVAFFAGRSGRDSVKETKAYRWVQRQMHHPARAFAVLFLLAAPLNPVFDIAGLTAGAMGLPYWLFATAVFLGRIVRMTAVSLIGLQLAS